MTATDARQPQTFSPALPVCCNRIELKLPAGSQLQSGSYVLHVMSKRVSGWLRRSQGSGGSGWRLDEVSQRADCSASRAGRAGHAAGHRHDAGVRRQRCGFAEHRDGWLRQSGQLRDHREGDIW